MDRRAILLEALLEQFWDLQQSHYYLLLTFRKKKELKETRKIAQQQNETGTIQLFENTFFNLLKEHRQILFSIMGVDQNLFPYCADTIRTYYKVFSEEQIVSEYLLTYKINIYPNKANDELRANYSFLLDEKLKDDPDWPKKILDRLIEIKEGKNDFVWSKITYKRFYFQYHTRLGHYYRSLYHILKFVKTAEVRMFSSSSKSTQLEVYERFKAYTDLMQAQMSSDELFLIFYNGLCYDKLHNLLDHYKILENLSVSELIEAKHKRFYPNINFKQINTDIDHIANVINCHVFLPSA